MKLTDLKNHDEFVRERRETDPAYATEVERLKAVRGAGDVRTTNSPDDAGIEDELALIRAGHRLECEEPRGEAMDRSRRVLTGETSPEDAREELHRKWGGGQSDPDMPIRRELETRDRLDVDEGGSWVLSTESGDHYQLLLDGDERVVIPLSVDTGHSYPDGTHPLRRNGETRPLLGLVNAPIRVGRPARFIFGDPADPRRASTVGTTPPVVEIRRSRSRVSRSSSVT
ncbi:hypothetical protein [Isoptericola sp. BMS4]|uniref:hypothetical protein n=1 Tax=Isoptericola sp. BMS4 TaxID=2527875 RepID=UPI00142013FC|nr:hypothetical protein [Isoptericola sp. BMS4]